MRYVILVGAPGAGKGTQAALLHEAFGLPHVSTGDLFRYEMGNDTPLGKEAKSYISKGELVPDEVTVGMLRNKVEANPDVQGYIFDGFPRTIPQAEALRELLARLGEKLDCSLELDIPRDVIFDRKMPGKGNYVPHELLFGPEAKRQATSTGLARPNRSGC